MLLQERLFGWLCGGDGLSLLTFKPAYSLVITESISVNEVDQYCHKWEE